MTPGFIDNGAGVAGTLTIAKAFIEAYKTGWRAPFRIRFVFFTAEEFGLVGSLHYISEHKFELENIIGVINLDSIGGLRLKVLNSSSILNELALEAAEELVVLHTEEYNIFSFLNHNCNLQTAADHLCFENPKSALLLAKSNWPELNLFIDSSVSIPAITVSSRPIYSSYIRTGEKPCWIHTSFDNSSTPGWADENRLKQHVEVSALTICKAMETAVLRGTLSTYMIFHFESIFQLLPIDRDVFEAEFIEKTENAN